MRVGIGYDVHALKKGEKLILGGKEIEYKFGLVGHSDADVLVHALMDALLGAIGKGDIGQIFPDSDPQYKGESSLVLLAKVMDMVNNQKLVVNNLDTVIIAEKPKLAPHLAAMKKNLQNILSIDHARINIKATTTEKLGFIGREEGIAAQAVVSLAERGE
jgi:2-C-methyl-D-erythritol 2,4-cyclodiphosphate synthase